MAITSSAKKALRTSMRKRVFNIRRKDAMRDALKGFIKVVATKNLKEATALMPSVYQAIDKAAKRGVIKPNAASRRKARVARLLKSIQK